MNKPTTSIKEDMDDIKRLSDEILKPQAVDESTDPADERRTLSNGLVKDTLTGFVHEPLCRDRSEFDPDLKSNL